MKTKTSAPYENNPFNIGLTGLRLLFENAKNVAIFAIVLSVIGLISSGASTANDISNDLTKTNESVALERQAGARAVQEFFAQDAGTVAVTAVIAASALFLFIVISLWLYGVLDYTGARLAKGEKVGLKEALGAVGKELASYIWLYIIIVVKVLLWSLLFIIPGIIMAVRYSLAGTAFFAEGKRGNAAVKRSLELTEGAWFTTFAGISLWNLMTIGMISYLLQPGINAVLYRQFAPLTDARKPKPATHWLSWATFAAPLLLIGFIISVAIVIAILMILLER